MLLAYHVSNKQRTKHHILARWSVPMIGHWPFSDETGFWRHDEQRIIIGNGTCFLDILGMSCSVKYVKRFSKCT